MYMYMQEEEMSEGNETEDTSHAGKRWTTWPEHVCVGFVSLTHRLLATILQAVYHIKKLFPFKIKLTRFARQKQYRVGHVGFEAIKMVRVMVTHKINNYSIHILFFQICTCFLSASFPASSPKKSRVVEALF